MTDEVYGEDHRGKDRDEDQQAPASAQTIFAEKNLAQGGWLCGWYWLGGGYQRASWSKGRLVQKIVLLSGYTQSETIWFHSTRSEGYSVQRKRARCSLRMQRSITTKMPAVRAFSAAFW